MLSANNFSASIKKEAASVNETASFFMQKRLFGWCLQIQALARKQVIEVSYPVYNNCSYHRSLVLIFRDAFVIHVALSMPDFAIVEIIPFAVGLAETHGRDAVHGKIGMVGAAC